MQQSTDASAATSTPPGGTDSARLDALELRQSEDRRNVDLLRGSTMAKETTNTLEHGRILGALERTNATLEDTNRKLDALRAEASPILGALRLALPTGPLQATVVKLVLAALGADAIAGKVLEVLQALNP